MRWMLGWLIACGATPESPRTQPAGRSGIATPAAAGSEAQAPGADSSCRIEAAIDYREGLELDAYRPTAANGAAIVSAHPGGWHSGDRSDDAELAQALCGAGYTVFAVDYRLAPAHPYPAAVEDVAAAIAWVRERAEGEGLDPDRIGAVGASAGAQLVGLISTTEAQPLSACVMLSGPTDLSNPAYSRARGGVQQFLNGANPKEASPLHHVSPGDPPMLLLQGEADTLVPAEDARAMQRALAAAGVAHEVELYPDAPHMLHTRQRWAEDAMRRIVAFFDTHLAAP